MKYYELDNIMAENALYNYIIGERSNGKTTAVLRHIVRDYFETGRRGAIIRQMEEDIKGHKGASLFAGMIDGGMIDELTDGEYQGVKYFNRAYYLGKQDEMDNWVYEKEPFAHIFAISQSLHYKSNSYPNIGTIMFDEFMRQDHMYLKDEVTQFINLVSTLVRDKDIASIFLVANTVSWNSPYFAMFDMKFVSQMEPGEMVVFDRRSTQPSGKVLTTRIAVEYCESSATYNGKPSDKYFAGIINAGADMIINGAFSVPNYPRCPHSFTQDNVLMTCWVVGVVILRCRLMEVDEEVFFFVDLIDKPSLHGKRGVKEPDWEKYEFLRKDEDLVYSLEFSSERNHFTNPAMVYANRRTRWFPDALRANRLFFENNTAGAELMYYLNQARNHSVTSLHS